MRLLYVTRVNIDDKNNFGVTQKIFGQQNGFNANGIVCDLLYLKYDGIYLNNKQVHKTKLLPHNLRTYFFYFTSFGRILRKKLKLKEYQVLYIRHPFFDPNFFLFIKYAKKNYPDLKIILEIPTYPYDLEPRGFLPHVSLGFDKILRKFSQRYIDKIAHLGIFESIWNIPTIPIKNGIDIKPLHAINEIKKRDNELRFVGVGNWCDWHGLDRLFKGLVQYVNLKKHLRVSVEIIGAGVELLPLKKFCEQNNLFSFVKFYPPLPDEERDQILAAADIGIGTLGIHRKELQIDLSLKHRLYCYSGLPFILSTSDLDFPDTLDFVQYFQRDDSPIEIEKVIEFYNRISTSKTDIQKYAIENLSWVEKTKPITEYILASQQEVKVS